MNKILVLIEKDVISFSKYDKEINNEDLNNTNVINVKNLKFTEEYILNNLELISAFFNVILLKLGIDKVVIKNNDIALTVLNLIHNLDGIKKIEFTYDSELNYTTTSLLLDCKDLDKIICFNIPKIMLSRFKKDQIETRGKLPSISNFFKINDIETYSDIYNKNEITIPDNLDFDDVEDLVYFLHEGHNLRKIKIKNYDSQNLKFIIKHLRKNNNKKVNIIIYENENITNKILNDIKLFEKFNKKYNLNIKVKYSNEYKQKNRMKELNLILLRNIFLTVILVSLGLFIGYKILENNHTKKIEKNMDDINQKIDDIIAQEDNDIDSIESDKDDEEVKYVSSYYKDYSKVYGELLELNSDTVGWLTINNTKVNYPVVQTVDNDYYLDHAYDHTKNIAGWLYVDYRCDMDNISKNTIIYGHSSLKGNLMFTSLVNTLNSTWYNNNNNLNIKFSIKGNDINWQIFSIYTIDVTSDYLYTNFDSDSKFMSFVDKIKNRSINNFNVEVNSQDKILTLSTCYEDDSKRLVIHAKML